MVKMELLCSRWTLRGRRNRVDWWTGHVCAAKESKQVRAIDIMELQVDGMIGLAMYLGECMMVIMEHHEDTHTHTQLFGLAEASAAQASCNFKLWIILPRRWWARNRKMGTMTSRHEGEQFFSSSPAMMHMCKSRVGTGCESLGEYFLHGVMCCRCCFVSLSKETSIFLATECHEGRRGRRKGVRLVKWVLYIKATINFLLHIMDSVEFFPPEHRSEIWNRLNLIVQCVLPWLQIPTFLII